ncbi:MAG: hypothetical protein AVDCRST_MAG90-2987, partial [uncultured Microvirga sp.]
WRSTAPWSVDAGLSRRGSLGRAFAAAWGAEGSARPGGS